MKNKTHIKKYITGVTALTGLTATSQATIVYSNPADVTLSLGQSASFDMLTGVITPGGSATDSAFRFENYDLDYVFLQATSNLPDPAIGGLSMSRLTTGATIDGSQSFFVYGNTTTFFDYYNAPFPWNTDTNGTNGYLGLRFDISGSTHYAWAQFTYNDASGTITLHDFAYEDTPNTAILAGQTTTIPEPSGLLLLASGAVLAARRKRKAA